MIQDVRFPTGMVRYRFDASPQALSGIATTGNIIFLTDENVYALYASFFAAHPTIVIPAGEQHKTPETAQHIIQQFITKEVDKSYCLVAVGGGVITDMAGWVAATYMRGIRVGYVPTTLLAMVDAAIGGKNGVNIGVYKNLMGTIRQPEFIHIHYLFLQTLPTEEWSNGFAEIIKYACLFDQMLLEELQQHNITYYNSHPEALQELVTRCVAYKNKTVLEDEQEKGLRKLLNFGHTIGHAIENNYELSHGKAIAIGMVAACKLSEQVIGLPKDTTEVVIRTLQQYGLPTSFSMDTDKIMHTLRMDKKRVTGEVDYIVLKDVGQGSIRKTSFNEIESILKQLL